MAILKRIVIHCTDTPQGREVSKYDITRWHKNPKPLGNGWTHYGYHLLVHLNGDISLLQPLPKTNNMTNDCVANGVKGYNADSLHVCYVGGREKTTKKHIDTRTPAQKLVLQEIVRSLRNRYGHLAVVGHRDLNPARACPCFDAITEYNNV